MKFTVMRPAEVGVEGINVQIPKSCIHEDDDVPDSFMVQTTSPTIHLSVNSGGYVAGWGQGRHGRLQLKVRDQGIYTLFGAGPDGYWECSKVNDYVPACVPGECGDYIDIDIDENGFVKNWNRFWTMTNVKESFFETGDE
jgi:hypothetical protein